MADLTQLELPDGSTYDLRDTSKEFSYKFGYTASKGNLDYIKITINSTARWMLCFTVTIYANYRAIKVMISGYQYHNSYWSNPKAVILGDSNKVETCNVYFGYDSVDNLWIGFDNDNYTGVSINDVANGFTQITDLSNLFTVSLVETLGGTTQKTVTAETRANYANSAGDASTVNSHTVATDVPSGAVFTDTTYTAGAGLSLSSEEFSLGTTWEAITQGQKWSRLYLATPKISTVGNSGILSIRCTRSSVVCNATFLITTSHASSDYANCIELASNNYTSIRVRLVANSSGNYYFEVYDDAASIASGTTQKWYCTFIPLVGTTLTTYTAFTDGTTVPSGYTAMNDFTTTKGKTASAIKNISRSGTTFTATRQDGSTFTFTQQDSNTTYSLTQDSTDGHKITLTPSSGTAQTVTIPDNNTTYTFANGTNGFTVTPSGGTAQTVTVTPSITNNVTGSGTSGYLTKFNGANTITNGPQLGSSTTTYLRNDGSWETPVGTTYSGGTGISIGTGNAINHSNSVTAQTTQKVYPIKIDAQGHISAYGTSPTTLSGYGITDAKIASGVITLGSNTITPLTASSTLDATKLSGTIPSGCYTDTKNTTGSTNTSSKIFLVGATSQAANPQTYSHDTAYVGTDGCLYSGGTKVLTAHQDISGKVDVANIDIAGQTTTLRELTQALGTAGTHYARWYSKTDGGTSGISDKPTGSTNAGFVCEAYCNRWNGASDFRYVLICWVQSEKSPYIAVIQNNSTDTSWTQLPTTDTKNTAGSTDTSSKIFLIGATSQAANPQTYSDDQVYVTSGTLQTNILSAANGVIANSLGSATTGGLSLWTTDPDNYGISMRKTGNVTGQLGKHGYVQGDYATYFSMNTQASATTNRGWIFREVRTTTNIASIDISGNAVFNGSVTIGGNTTNTSGARMEYNTTTQAIDFVFN